MKKVAAYAILPLLLLSHLVADAKDYCSPQPKAKSESDTWYIPESAFTKAAANKALQNLTTQVNHGVKGLDFMIETDLVMIKGYLYLSYIAQHKKQFGKDDPELIRQFCVFLAKDAYVSH